MVDKKLQERYLNPETKKGKQRHHKGLGFMGNKIKEFSSGESRLIKYKNAVEDQEFQAQLDRDTFTMPADLQMDINLIVNGVGEKADDRKNEEDLRDEQRKLRNLLGQLNQQVSQMLDNEIIDQEKEKARKVKDAVHTSKLKIKSVSSMFNPQKRLDMIIA